MYKVLDNSLYVKNQKDFSAIRKRAIEFNSIYNGSNIIQDDIFHVVENYAARQEMPLDFLRYDLLDDNFCACTFIRAGRVFVVVNSAMTISKQIFAVAHELYHLYNYFEHNDPRYRQSGSILDSSTIDEETEKSEDMEANAFAGLLLAPGESILQQIRIYGIREQGISLDDVIMLMEIYAIPYKAMVLRLYEENLITSEKAREFLDIADSVVVTRMKLTGKALRWQKTTKNEVMFGSLYEQMERALQIDAMAEDRFQRDKERIKEIRNKIESL